MIETLEITIPLFRINIIGTSEYAFQEKKFVITPFDPHNQIPSSDLFSIQDVSKIKTARWALKIIDPGSEDYEEDINLILMSIRILKNFSPFVRFFLCIKDARHNYRLDTAMIPTKPENSDNTISIKEFYKVEDYYNSLLNLRSISTRTHNAVFFLYKAFHAIHWVDAYLFYMLAIEALFSKDEGGSAKKTFIDRTHCFLAKEIIPHDKDLLEKVYKLRSFIVHGKPISRSKPDQNIAELLQVENLAIAVFKKILDQKLADRFKDSERDRFLNGAVASKKNNDRTNHRTLLLKE